MTKSSTTLISIPDTGALAQERDRFTSLAESLVIETPADYVGAAAMFKSLKIVEERIHEKTDEPVSLAHRTHKSIKELQNALLKPVEAARRLVKRKMGNYDFEQERKRREEEERLRREAEKRAEDERLVEAERLEARGDSATAEALLAAPIPPPPPVCLPTGTPKVSGVSFRKDWDVVVVNEALVPPEYKVTDLKIVKAKVKRMQGNVEIPGIRITPRII